MQIRAATTQDSQEISQLIIPLVKTHILPSCSACGGKRLLESMSAAKIHVYITQGYQYHIIKDHGVIIALIGMRDNTHLYHLFVSDNYQGKGLASRLWQHAKAQCQARASTTRFTVNAAINAQHYYQRWGFIADSGIRTTAGIKDVPMTLHTTSNTPHSQAQKTP